MKSLFNAIFIAMILVACSEHEAIQPKEVITTYQFHVITSERTDGVINWSSFDNGQVYTMQDELGYSSLFNMTESSTLEISVSDVSCNCEIILEIHSQGNTDDIKFQQVIDSPLTLTSADF